MDKVDEKVRLIYIGIGLDKSNRKFYQWADVTDVSNDGQHLSCNTLTWSKQIVTARPGAIWEFFVSPDKKRDGIFSVFTGGDKSPVFVEIWKNKEDVIRWQTTVSALDLQQRIINAQKKKADQNLSYDILEPFHQAYMNAPQQHRPLILAHVISRITRGTIIKEKK